MAHAPERKLRTGDTSIDEPWVVDETLAFVDSYLLYTSIPVFFLKFLVFFLPCVIFAAPIMALCATYAHFLSTPKVNLNRDTLGWFLLKVLVAVLGSPFIVLGFLCYFWDCFWYYFWSVPLFLGRCCCAKGKVSLKDSCAALEPYYGGPSVVCYMIDVLVALIGQVTRHGFLECTMKLAGLVMYVPWIKYYLNCNPWAYQLDERFIQQISTSLADMSLGSCAAALRRIISRCKQERPVAMRVDHWEFVPHYPYPPPGRDWALALQAAGRGGEEGCFSAITQMFLVVHATHCLQLPPSLNLRRKDYFVMSNSVDLPLYRVMLWYSNPYHFFTGFVEASVSTGGLSQPEKFHGGEHPMWLVTSHSPMLNKRDSPLGVGWIDNFFDKWLPHIMKEVRTLVRGTAAAEELFQEVQSDDGKSVPRALRQFKQTDEGKTISIVDGRVTIDGVEWPANDPCGGVWTGSAKVKGTIKRVLTEKVLLDNGTELANGRYEVGKASKAEQAKHSKAGEQARYMVNHALTQRLGQLMDDPAALREKMAGMFSEFDTDGDHSVSPDDLRAGLLKLGVELSDEQHSQLFQALDRKGDGAIDIAEIEMQAIDISGFRVIDKMLGYLGKPTYDDPLKLKEAIADLVKSINESVYADQIGRGTSAALTVDELRTGLRNQEGLDLSDGEIDVLFRVVDDMDTAGRANCGSVTKYEILDALQFHRDTRQSDPFRMSSEPNPV